MQNKLLLGAHMSISGGVEKSIYRGASIDCTAIQIFTGSNRSWKSKKFTDHEIGLFKKAQEETKIYDVISHAPYLINIATTNHDILEKSINALNNELFKCHQLDIKYLVLHPGAGVASEEKAMQQAMQVLLKILESNNTNVSILLENTAGQGASIGYSFEQLAYLFDNLKATKKIGICFDTCHGWAAGYEFSTKESYIKMWDTFDKLIGIKHLRAIHLNDSVKEKGSYVDRHQDIGHGTIPIEAFKLLINDERFFSIPKILETPKDDKDKNYELKEDRKNLKTIKDLIDSDTRKKLKM